MDRPALRLTVFLIALPLAGCGGSNQAQAPATNIEEMGPEGGSNITTTPPANSATAPVGSTSDGNVAPGDANPSNARPGTQPGSQ